MPSDSLIPQRDVPLAPFTTLGVGGRASWFASASSIDEALAARRWAADNGLPVFVLGGGSNLVVADKGFPGLVLRAGFRGCNAVVKGDEYRIEAGAGETWDNLVERAVDAGFGGLECLSGIPGSVGGTPIQNVGAYGQEVGDVIESVDAIDCTTDSLVQLRAGECEFTYRHSRFKGRDAGRFLVTSVAFCLQARKPTLTYPDVIAHVERQGLREPSVGDVRCAVLAIRRSKGMVLDPDDPDTRSVGSFFMNPVVTRGVHDALAKTHGSSGPVPGFHLASGAVKIPAAWLIERVGFTKGYAAGAVGVSSKHPLAIVNRGGATARVVIELAALIKRRVIDTFGIWLRIEPVCVGFDKDSEVEFLQRIDA